ncbi:MAG: sulfite oxidase [Gammaproteobacteria bacterium]|nr:sulfite oxidase [Gammaproteobacteria bacterium]
MSKQEEQDQGPELNTRRTALKTGVALGGMAASASMPFWSQLAMGASEELVPFSDMPEGYTVPPVAPGGIHYLDTSKIDSFYTPNDDFYIIQHYNQPQIADADFRLRISGLINNPFELSLADLKSRQKFEIDAGFECGGNSPRLFQGLIGNARWGGVRLVDLLEEAGLQRDGVEVVFYGADKGMEKTRSDLDMEVEQSFGRSMHIDDALNPDIILAYEMNGEPLPLYHGAPLRVVVPGWYGVANVKWLDQIHIQDSRYMGRFMGRDYVTLSKRNIGGEERWEERSVTRIQLKSSIIRVTRNGRDHNITGFVLNDGTPLRSVEVKIDNGPWQRAEIDPASSKYSWKLFNYTWRDASAGEHTIVSRVTDVTGQVQATADQMPEKPTRWENYAQFPRRVMIS